MSTGEEIRMSRAFEVTPERLWEALTENDELKQWYFDFNDNFKLEEGHVFDWEAGPPNGKKWHHRGKILEVIPNRKLSHSWEFPGYEGMATLTWLLESKAEEATMLIILFEFEKPFIEEELKRENFVTGWNLFLNELLPQYFEK